MLPRNRYLEENDGEGNDLPGAEGGEGKPEDATPDLGAVSEGMASLSQNMAAMQEGINTLFQKISEREERDMAEPEPEPEPNPLDSDLETLSRADFANAIVKAVTSNIEQKMVKPVKETVTQLHDRVETRDVRAELKEAASNHKDFMEWRDEMVAKAKTVQGLSAEDAYFLARASNPDKAKEMDKKYADPAPEDKREKPFGGMRPQSGTTERTTTMKPHDAAEAAWEETMSELGDAL
jgi:hypothetical protein